MMLNCLCLRIVAVCKLLSGTGSDIRCYWTGPGHRRRKPHRDCTDSHSTVSGTDPHPDALTDWCGGSSDASISHHPSRELNWENGLPHCSSFCSHPRGLLASVSDEGTHVHPPRGISCCKMAESSQNSGRRQEQEGFCCLCCHVAAVFPWLQEDVHLSC